MFSWLWGKLIRKSPESPRKIYSRKASMKLPLAYYGAPVLRKKASIVENIDDEIRQLVADMIESMDEYHGCGLAAPQVHRSIALFVTRIPHRDENDAVIEGEARVYINPKIVAYSEEVCVLEEGCLSIPVLREEVVRPMAITVQATDLEGRTFTEELVEFDARVILHENDHLNGVLYIDRIHPNRKKAIEKELREIKKKYNS